MAVAYPGIREASDSAPGGTVLTPLRDYQHRSQVTIMRVPFEN
jgi:hypothetical protein